jgi:hypothetical protein
VEVSTVIRGASPATQTISSKSETDEEKPKTLLEIYTEETPEDNASGTEVQETDAPDTEILQAQIDLIRLRNKKRS